MLAASGKMEQIQLRENCIGIKYNSGLRQQFYYELVLDDILGIPDEEIEAIDTRGKDKWIFQVKSKEKYDNICEKFTGRDISLGNNCWIQVDDISSPGTRVEISCVPFSITNKQLSGMLRKYGEIYKCQNYYRTFDRYNKLKSTGNRIMWMKLHDHIPQSLNIKKRKLVACLLIIKKMNQM